MTNVPGRFDPVTYEIIRHRLWRITDEQGKIVIRTSGSPVAYDAKDFSTGIFTAEGDGLFISTYTSLIGVSVGSVAKAVIAQFGDDVNPGDMFFCNDPWIGGVGHANDQCMVGPMFHDGQIIGWAGVGLHDGDIGGTVAGVHPSAPDARHEGPLIPPVKLVEGGRLRPDLEAWAVRGVRDPGANGLHIRARMAAISNTQSQLSEIVEAHGLQTYLDFVSTYIARNRAALETRLAELPDGTWFEEVLIDHNGHSPSALTKVHCAMTKTGTHIKLDFSESAPAAGGPINCTRKGLEVASIAAVMGHFCYDTGWCPAAMNGLVEVVSKPGTIISANYPSPVGLATTAGMGAVGVAVRSCLGKLFAESPTYRDRAMALTGSSGTGSMIWGLDHDGAMKLTLGSFSITRGSGAYCSKDGEDGGGFVGAPAMSIYNVEVAEFANPLVLTLYRKVARDTAGAGKFRGGAGMEMALALRDGYEQLRVNWGAMAFHHPHSKGLYGGLPGAVSGSQVLQGTNVKALLAGGTLPRGREELQTASLRPLEAKTVDAHLAADDILLYWFEGGGGFGDPLDRDIAMVEQDLQTDRCSVEVARNTYGLVFDDAGQIDRSATVANRDAIRKARLGAAHGGVLGAEHGPQSDIGPIGQGLRLVHADGVDAVACEHCGHIHGPATADPRATAAMHVLPLEEVSSYNRYAFNRGEVELREFLCPACGSRMGTELRESDEGVMLDHPSAGTAPAELEPA